jgi:hypothetical protein
MHAEWLPLIPARMRSMCSMRGGFIFRNRGPSLMHAYNVCTCVTNSDMDYDVCQLQLSNTGTYIYIHTRFINGHIHAYTMHALCTNIHAYLQA